MTGSRPTPDQLREYVPAARLAASEAAREQAEKERDEWIAQHQELARAEYVGDPAADARVRAAETERDRLAAALEALPWDRDGRCYACRRLVHHAPDCPIREALNPGDGE